MVNDITLPTFERHQRILEQLTLRGFIRVKDLAPALGVHEMTVRRDLDALAEQGLVSRLRGGARIAEQASHEIAYHLRSASNTESKARIARAALELIQDGDTVALDASTTVLALAKILGSRSVQAIVSSLDAANVLASQNVPFTFIGGTFNPSARSFVGPLATSALARLHADKAFFSAKGVTVQSGFTDANLLEVESKEQLVKSAQMVIALIDHSKFGKQALTSIVGLDQTDVLITDRRPDAEMLQALENADVRLIVAQE
ncbi:DeoR/GlpR family DNA-binding transcription regulator [uncultured Meiothermus sp.]|jgi:DeoR/GlpR family transcriptional regulator of sugar metabolism|uniref:DeoR/GlpR family DNA-binding transcription regulator n=1 Tax=uncultured Meiothermus sp. TaxID=157471 RepID=UPI0026148EC0|nr:DeoR/GlpR family DNA-binding transcription regulator [uncultured Meiothermus sp.]